jgi:NAD(P)-dependent dehydrogenase (short-subunit alcohol dehydrogenase family)
MKNFKDKVVVITGAASGMGRSYALMFAKLGSKIAICDYNEKGLRETEKMVMELADVHVYAEKLDVSDKAGVYAFAQGRESRTGQRPCDHQQRRCQRGRAPGLGTER